MTPFKSGCLVIVVGGSQINCFVEIVTSCKPGMYNTAYTNWWSGTKHYKVPKVKALYHEVYTDIFEEPVEIARGRHKFKAVGRWAII